MKYYTIPIKFSRRERKEGKDKELRGKITALDRAILQKSERGSDLMGLVMACKPYVNKWGGKEFANSPRVRGAVEKLMKLGLLERH